jgi:mono/diheme cytochrome c family protein
VIKLTAGAVLSCIALLTCGAWAQGDAKRGLYLSKAAGCMGCHTAEAPGSPAYAGGRALKTPFGTFHGPNITPHPAAGIGGWTEANFVAAMRMGTRPDGSHYYPAFPYASFTRINDADLRDLWAYLQSLPPDARPSQPHDLRFPFSWRWLMAPWKWLFFRAGPYMPDPKLTPVQNRGGYLVQALSHCGECHTPRNFLGAPKRDRLLAGAKDIAPNITPARLKQWSDAELKSFFDSGLTPDNDMVSGEMEEVVRNTTSQLAPTDLDALIAYLRTIPAVEPAR